MEYAGKWALVDETGQPFSAHVARALHDVTPKLLRTFPSLRDDLLITEILEEAGRKIVRHERHVGPIDRPHGYAWVTVKSIATTKMRRGEMRFARAMLDAEESHTALNGMRSDFGSPERVEATIQLREVLERLTPDEQLLCTLKRWGFSSREIARDLGSTPQGVDSFFHRVKQKILSGLNGVRVAEPETAEAPPLSQSLQPTRPRSA